MKNQIATIQAIEYIIKKCSETNSLDKLSILRLLFLADRYSMQLTGRTIGEDDYLVSELGVFSEAGLDIVSFREWIKNDTEYLHQILETDGHNAVKIKKPLVFRDDYSQLSESDFESLDFAINTFGIYSGKFLKETVERYYDLTKYNEKVKREKQCDYDILDFLNPNFIDNIYPFSKEQLDAQIAWLKSF